MVYLLTIQEDVVICKVLADAYRVGCGAALAFVARRTVVTLLENAGVRRSTLAR